MVLSSIRVKSLLIFIPPSFITTKEKGYISNLLALIENGSKKEWIKLKDGTTITITT